ncbi:MAG: YhbY family RNA-binding protein [bacterium]|nr:YhbY family RNA-binding protein [bacterium]
MLKGKERAEFRKQANTLEPIFQIGKADIGDAMIDAIDGALEKRELIKISVLDTSGLTARDAAELLSAATGAEVIQCIGRKFVLYRKREEA